MIEDSKGIPTPKNYEAVRSQFLPFITEKMSSINWKKSYNIKECGNARMKKISSKNHNNKSMVKLSKLWQNKRFCDVKIIVEGREISAHRNILAINSNYFDAMFSHWYKENSEEGVRLNGLTYNSVYSLIEFMYTGTIILNGDNVQDILVASDLIQIDEVKSLCCSYLEEYIDSTNCLGIMNLGELYNCKELYENSVKLIKQQFVVVCQTDEFLTLPYCQLLKMLTFNDLCLDSQGEDFVFKSLLSWLDANPDARTVDITQLLSQIKFKFVQKSAIKKLLLSPLIHENKVLMEVMVTQIDESRKPAVKRGRDKDIYVVGGFLQSRTGPLSPRLATVEKYQITEDKWENVAELPFLPSGIQIFSVYGRMFIFAFEFGVCEKMIHMLEYDPLQNKWKDAAKLFTDEAQSLIQNDSVIATCKAKNKVYVISTKSVHSIKVKLCDGTIYFDKVKKLPPVCHFYEEKNSNYCCIVVDKQLYVLGGCKRLSGEQVQTISNVSVFNGKLWLTATDMLQSRSMFDVVHLGFYIYALGGVNCRTVERYDTTCDQWTYISDMETEKSHLRAVVVSNKIYVLGGKSYLAHHSGGRKVLNTCEMYNPETDSWQNVKPMKHSRCMFGAIIF